MTKGKGSVSGFTDAQGVTHLPDDIVDLPASYLGETWLKPVEKEAKPVAAASKVEAAVPGPVVKPEPANPLPEKKPPKTK
jgi:hypothetical protein